MTTLARLHVRLRAWMPDITLAILFVILVGPFVQTLTAQGAARYAYSAAIVEEQTVRLDSYEAIVGIDRVELDGHLYSDKAPAQPLLGAPVLQIAEWLGAEPATEFRLDGNLGLWSQTLVFCTLPGAFLLVLIRRHLLRHAGAATSLLTAVGLVCTTMLLPLSSHLYGHVLSATLLFSAWHLVSAEDPPTSRILLAGVLAGFACATEYPVVLGAAIIGVWVLSKLGLRAAAKYGIPIALAGGLIIAHNHLLFGSSTTGYTAKSSGGQVNFLSWPKLEYIGRILFGERGFIFTPIVLIAIAGLVVGVVQRRSSILVPLAVLIAYLWLQAGWSNPWGGEGPGPRYISTAIPFLALPAALVIGRISRRATYATLAIGAASMVPAVLTMDLVPHGSALISTHLTRISEEGLSPTLFTMAFGDTGWIIHFAAAALALRLAGRHLDTSADPPSSETGSSRTLAAASGDTDDQRLRPEPHLAVNP